MHGTYMTVSKRFPLPPGDYAHPHPWNSAIRPMLLHDIFAGQAQKTPGATLVEFLGRRLSYRELHREAERFAAGLAERGIAKGDRVGLFLPNVPSYVSAYYGAMMAGAVVVNFSRSTRSRSWRRRWWIRAPACWSRSMRPRCCRRLARCSTPRRSSNWW